MPIYYFETRDGVSAERRHEIDLPNLDAARQEAMRRARLHALNLNPSLDEGACFVVAVSDARNAGVLTVRLACSVDSG